MNKRLFLLFVSAVSSVAAWQLGPSSTHATLGNAFSRFITIWQQKTSKPNWQKELQKTIQADSTLKNALSNPTDDDIVAFKHDLTFLMTTLLEELAQKDFGWCSCMGAGVRLLFVIDLYQHIASTYPDTSNPITITSLASGNLLQDYLTSAFLIHKGYLNQEYTLVDSAYPILQAMSKDYRLFLPTTIAAIKQLEKKLNANQRFANHFVIAQSNRELKEFLEKNDIRLPDSFFALVREPMPLTTMRTMLWRIANGYRAADRIDLFQARLSSLARSNNDAAQIEFVYYENPEIYRQKMLALKTKQPKEFDRLVNKVLIMVDPGMGFGNGTEFPSEANAFAIRTTNNTISALLFIDSPNIYLYHSGLSNHQAIIQKIKKKLGKNLSRGAIYPALHRLQSDTIRITLINDSVIAFKELSLDTTAPDAVIGALWYSVYHKTRSMPTIQFFDRATLQNLDAVTSYNGLYLAKEFHLHGPEIFSMQ